MAKDDALNILCNKSNKENMNEIFEELLYLSQTKMDLMNVLRYNDFRNYI